MKCKSKNSLMKSGMFYSKEWIYSLIWECCCNCHQRENCILFSVYVDIYVFCETTNFETGDTIIDVTA